MSNHIPKLCKKKSSYITQIEHNIMRCHWEFNFSEGILGQYISEGKVDSDSICFCPLGYRMNPIPLAVTPHYKK